MTDRPQADSPGFIEESSPCGADTGHQRPGAGVRATLSKFENQEPAFAGKEAVGLGMVIMHDFGRKFESKSAKTANTMQPATTTTAVAVMLILPRQSSTNARTLEAQPIEWAMILGSSPRYRRALQWPWLNTSQTHSAGKHNTEYHTIQCTCRTSIFQFSKNVTSKITCFSFSGAPTGAKRSTVFFSRESRAAMLICSEVTCRIDVDIYGTGATKPTLDALILWARKDYDRTTSN